jgi:hypothetical protein
MMAYAQRADKGTNHGSNIQNAAALVAREINDPVRALEFTKPRRTKI